MEIPANSARRGSDSKRELLKSKRVTTTRADVQKMIVFVAAQIL
jgi:hypothetical protein